MRAAPCHASSLDSLEHIFFFFCIRSKNVLKSYIVVNIANAMVHTWIHLQTWSHRPHCVRLDSFVSVLFSVSERKIEKKLLRISTDNNKSSPKAFVTWHVVWRRVCYLYTSTDLWTRVFKWWSDRKKNLCSTVRARVTVNWLWMNYLLWLLLL